MKLNLGCGENYREGWINIDGNPALKADYHCDLLDKAVLSQFDGQCEWVHAWQCLEHLEVTDTVKALVLWLNLLAVRGDIEIIVPDFEYIAHNWLTLPKDELWNDKWWQLSIFGLAQVGGGELERHRQLFTHDRLSRFLKLARPLLLPRRFVFISFPDNKDFTDNSLHCQIRRIA